MPVSDPTYQVILADGKTDATLADITRQVTYTVQPRLSRPCTVSYKATQADSASFWTVAADGHPNLSPLDRTIKLYRNGTLIANNELLRCDWSGDENKQTAEMTTYDAGWRLPGRMVRDADGRIDAWKFVDPTTYSTNPTLPAGATIQQLFQNSHTFDDPNESETAPGFYTGPRVFPIDYSSGSFSAAANIWDLFSNGPLDLGTFVYSTVADTGLCDIVLTPTDTSHGAAAGVYSVLNVVSQWGTDKSGTVHFDYNLGDNSIRKVDRSLDGSTVATRLRYLLGPKSNRPDHWAGSIDRATNHDGSSLVEPLDDNMWLARERYGMLFAMRVYDSDPTNTVRWLFHSLFNTELSLRLAPRELVAVVPSAACPFKPWTDYDIGDIVSVNLARTVGPPTSGTPQAQMRVYGFDVDVDVNGVETVTKIYNSADAVQSSVAPA